MRWFLIVCMDLLGVREMVVLLGLFVNILDFILYVIDFVFFLMKKYIIYLIIYDGIY